MSEFSGRTIVLGVGGGIAAYKACELARLFVKGGGVVPVAMTEAATRFVGPLIFQALTGAPVLTDVLGRRRTPTAISSWGARPTCWCWPRPRPT